MKTPKNKKKQSEKPQAEKSSGKKMVQARLPFQIISASPGSVSATEERVKDDSVKDLRKRKLSLASSDDDTKAEKLRSKENLLVETKKKKSDDKEGNSFIAGEIVVLDDDDINEKLDGKVSDSREPLEAVLHKPSVAGAPQPSNGKGKGKSGAGNANTLQIKLPLPNKKRRKSQAKSAARKSENVDSGKEAVAVDSSDENEQLAKGLNPGKKQKVDEEQKASEEHTAQTAKTPDQSSPVITLSDDELTESNQESHVNCTNGHRPEPKTNVSHIAAENSEHNAKEKTTLQVENGYSEPKTPKSSKNARATQDTQPADIVTDATDIEADDESVDITKSTTNLTSSCEGEEVKESTDNMTIGNNGVALHKSASSASQSEGKKALTPKQVKLMERRRQAREEKERKLQEEKLQKHREKEERELIRKREREEKEHQKRKERDEKNQKRLAEIEAKNEEKRKRNEAREEEQRKKDEERKRKEQEKEEVKLKEKKAAQAFTKFFVPKPGSTSCGDVQDVLVSEGDSNSKEFLAFRPFQVKGDMTLAPLVRKNFTEEAKQLLDSFINVLETDTSEPIKSIPEFYLTELKSGRITPYKWRRTAVVAKEDDDVLVVDDLERAGEEIVEETHVDVEHFRVKYYKFFENRRPPYFGTWRKKTNVITPRRPFAQDKHYFDYEVDSDLEWEDEEPGESLDGSDDDKEKESEDDDYEVDNEWFVPHGHLSEEEMQNEYELGLEENTREAQKAKLKILQQEFAQEMKKKTEKIKPRLVGCIWVDENGNQPELCPNIIWNMMHKHAMLFTVPPLVEEPDVPEKEEGNSPNQNPEKIKPLELSEGLMGDLARLLHGNRHSKVFLIKEFLAYVEATEDAVKNGGARGPLKSAVREKIDELAEWKVVEIAKKNKKKKNKKRLCWVVSDDMLKKMNLEDLSLSNKWTYTLQPKYLHIDDEVQLDQTVAEEDEAVDTTIVEGEKDAGNASNEQKAHQSSKITKFKKTLTAKEKTAEPVSMAPQAATSNSQANPKSASKAPAAKKRVALLSSAPLGQQTPAAAKNVLISKFLKTNSATAATTSSTEADAEVIVLE